MKISFGDFIKERRSEKGISLREMAKRLNLAPSYLSDIEKGRRNPPEKDRIEDIVRILEISDTEVSLLFDLAGKSRKEVPSDLPDYINENDKIRALLRTAKKTNPSDELLEELIKRLEKKD